MIFIVTLILATLGTALAGKYNCTNNPVTNGCTTWRYTPYKDIFEADCHRHDVCYSCGTEMSYTRKLCDYIFYDDLLDTCKTDERADWYCTWIAKLYYVGVNTLGSSYYREKADDWCNSLYYGYIPCLTLD